MTYLEEVNGRSITVRNVEYTIEVLPAEEIDEMAGEEVFGLQSNKDAKIYLRDGMNDDRAEQTLIHELLHAMFFESGYIFDNQEQEEGIVNALSLVMHDMSVKGSLEIAFDDPFEFVVGEPKKADPDDPRFQPLGDSPLTPKISYKDISLFPMPTFFCDNKPFKEEK
ncbi:hypothetical protein Riggi_72 [Bacillus phage Riggi]|uniref:Uncharacterized protein n=1 Tax=Bacillus phage Riggi TaxID=2884426 RepID=U5PWD0_9CAUD|nr:hypothetical protein Riggi_72 [Bacillus phage Riggi]AGY48234.1 hypothetical protein Riggi_72 [Bacillus phage Riggi]